MRERLGHVVDLLLQVLFEVQEVCGAGFGWSSGSHLVDQHAESNVVSVFAVANEPAYAVRLAAHWSVPVGKIDAVHELISGEDARGLIVDCQLVVSGRQSLKREYLLVKIFIDVADLTEKMLGYILVVEG